MKVIYCDCCKRKIGEMEVKFSIEIKRGNDKEHILDDVCSDCYNRIKTIMKLGSQ